ncbi:protein of unknown function [Carboxydocella sporoproducens DSM 16521]|uniref:Uncharacterized protein n=2 Tax=Carboxydocella TaxID=178898 RepID=A0A1T4QGL3_9FIRM|nr:MULTISPECIES: DUF4907 domain-containing protein [Carboxydocella]AVX21585.1 protein of unknown function (DUF4907) [Carboxydocella thermautotrophica]SKA02757.1 protein of unknown function [Carboxydocella sporoproducens DSM 16521]
MEVNVKKSDRGYVVVIKDDETTIAQDIKPFVEGYQPIETEEEARAIAEQLIQHLQEVRNSKPPINPYEYAEKRRQEYPPIGDQLDALWKLLEPPAGTEAHELKQKILAIKARYPKPIA